MEISIDNIKELHKKGGFEIREELEKLYPSVFTRIALNGWHVDNRFPKWMAFWKDGKMLYGIDGLGNWMSKIDDQIQNKQVFITNARPIGELSIQNRLHQLSINLGFKKGIIVRMEKVGFNEELLSEEVVYTKIGDKFYFGANKIYEKGIWAKIVSSKQRAMMNELLDNPQFYEVVSFDLLEKLNELKNKL